MIIYDVEIQKAIAKDGEPRLAGIDYCKGFTDFIAMGVACVCAYCYDRDQFFVYGEFELEEFQKLVNQADVVVGYNILGFDNPLMAANDVVIPEARSYDLLAEIKRALGHRVSLDAICQANGFGTKNESGALAPVMWQRGEHTRVINYCLNDVRLTKKLLDRVIRRGFIKTPDGKLIQPRKP